jgi:hypothetical protein
MGVTKKLKIRNWVSGMLICLSYFNISAQENSKVQEGQISSEADFPRVISSDCDPSLAKCSGIIVWDDGSSYVGEFEFGKIQGKGKLLFADGSSYEGEFKNETFYGYGTMIYEDGSKYIGDWVLGYREGEGALVYPDGTEYLGEFESDQIHGEGSMILSSGESYSGNWEYGQTNGFGMITRLDGSVYLGMNEEGARHGSGMIVWESGDTLHGSWQDGKMVEEGTFQFEDGSSMISYWENGIMLDENIYIKPDGERYTASTSDLANQVLQNSWNDMEIVERNFGLAFYAIGMEYKSIMDFDRAKENLQYAAQFGDPMDNSSIKEMVEIQLANISSEKEQNGGVAKKSDDENH